MALATWLITILAIVSIGIGESWDAAARSVPIGIVLAVLGFAAFWRPQMVVSATGVRVINPFRRFELDWAAISRIDTRFALTLYVGERKLRVWAAPAPGIMRATLLAKRDFANLDLAEPARPADAIGTPSGDGAEIIRRMMHRLDEHGWRVTEHGAAERSAEPVEPAAGSEPGLRLHWNLGTIAVLAVSGIAALLLG